LKGLIVYVYVMHKVSYLVVYSIIICATIFVAWKDIWCGNLDICLQLSHPSTINWYFSYGTPL